jgi:hypothetical protein
MSERLSVAQCLNLISRAQAGPQTHGFPVAIVQAAYAAGVLAERERCAKVCDAIADRHLSSGRYSSIIADHSLRAGGQVDGAEECAKAIRSGPKAIFPKRRKWSTPR